MKDLKYKICNNCVLDTTVSDIEFNDSGVCNYCESYLEVERSIPIGAEAKLQLDLISKEIKSDKSRKSNYDCIVGISGGVDSTYLLFLVKEMGLSPLAVHIDTGWNSEISVSNVENLVKKLEVDLFTYVIDWNDMRNLQTAFFRASVPDCDIPQDHVFPSVLNRIAKEKGIKHIVSGHNFVTEYVIPQNWSFNSSDYRHIKDIYQKFGKEKIENYPFMKPFKRFIFYKYFYRIKTHRPLYFVEYNKDEIVKFISSKLGWKSYGGKHEESRFTKFFQNYYLFEKFGFDKRRAHLSNLVLAKQMSREQAMEILEDPPYSSEWLSREKSYILRKLNLSISEWDEIMQAAPREHKEFDSDENDWLVKCIRWSYLKLRN